MLNKILLLFVVLFSQVSAWSQAGLYYRTVNGANGNWNTVALWQVATDPNAQNNQWTAATAAPNELSAGVNLRQNAQITINSNVSSKLVSLTHTGSLLTIQSGGSLTIIDDGTSAVDLSIATGSLNNQGELILATGATLNLGNNRTLSNSGNLVVASGASITNAGILAIQNLGTVNVSGTVSISGTGSITGTNGSNVQFLAGSRYRHLVTTNGTIPSATWQPTSTTELAGYTGSVTATAASNWSQTFGNVDINLTNLGNNAVVNFQGFLNNIQGNLLIRSTGVPTARVVLSEINNTNMQIGGSIIQTAGILNVTNTASNINVTVNGNVELISGILNLSNGTGSSNLILKSDLYVVGGTFNPGNGGTVTFDGNSLVSGNVFFQHLTLTSAGAVNFQGAIVNVGGNLNLMTGGLINNPGPIVLNGSVDQDVNVNNLGFEELRITKTGGAVNLTSDFQVLGTVNIQSVTQVNSNGHLIITSRGRDTADDGSIGPIPAGASINGNVQVQRFMHKHNNSSNRYISIPVDGATPTAQLADDFTLGTGYIRWYNETISGVMNNGYTNFGLNSTFVRGRGYLIWNINTSTDITWDVTGNIYQGNINLPITYTITSGGIDNDGWNLVGNPYASAISWNFANDDGTGWEFSNDISPIVYIRDMQTGGLIAIDPDDVDGNNIISMGQAFWVKANELNPFLTIKEGAKSTSAAGTFYRKDNTVKTEKLIVQLNKGNQADLAVLKVNEQSTHEFDFRFDAHKLRNEQMNIYFIEAGGKQLGLNSIPEITYDERIYMGLEVAEPGEYQISFRNLETFSQADAMYLIDSFEGKAHPISSEQPYIFHVSKNSHAEQKRFYLSMNSMVPERSIADVVSVYPNPVADFLHIQLPAHREAKISIMDAKGHAVIQSNIKGATEIDFRNYNRGMYILRIMDGEELITRKIIK
jgi:hypothetical protein